MLRRRTGLAVPIAVLALTLQPAGAPADFGDRTLRAGHSGHDVRVLQSWLTHLGHRTRVDGRFGGATLRSVKRYERAQRLRRDGRVSRPQARRMRRQVERGRGRSGSRLRFGERELARGARGRDVRVLQSWLSHLGLPTRVDGVFGSGTERSVERYEAINELPEDGEVSRPDAARMRRQVEGREDMSKPPAGVRGDHTFPVKGSFRWGDGFGARRSGHSHQGQDLFAACGTPLVAAQGGKVAYAGFHSAAGHYVVITGERSGEDYVYMHLRRGALVGRGRTVATGERIGDVGESGNASGCHLHFELWSEPGWHAGGRAYDPEPALRAWAG